MKQNKTTQTTKSVADFLAAVSHETRRADAVRLCKLMEKRTGYEPKMWGPSIVGFGSCHYVYESGREGDMPLVGFSPRASALVVYLSGNFEGREELLKKLGKHKTTKGCVYIKTLEDVDVDVLMDMIALSVAHTRTLYPSNNS